MVDRCHLHARGVRAGAGVEGMAGDGRRDDVSRVVTRHNPACYFNSQHGTNHSLCLTEAYNSYTDQWIKVPPELDCNLSDYDGFCYTHKSRDCEAACIAWDLKHLGPNTNGR